MRSDRGRRSSSRGPWTVCPSGRGMGPETTAEARRVARAAGQAEVQATARAEAGRPANLDLTAPPA